MAVPVTESGQLQGSFRGEGNTGLCIRGVFTFIASFSGDGSRNAMMAEC